MKKSGSSSSYLQVWDEVELGQFIVVMDGSDDAPKRNIDRGHVAEVAVTVISMKRIDFE